ncbi:MULTISPECIES: metal/formaldehyde-sensitive transcriptional repressor [Phenylobacterium]|uniref:DNA-binding FrmR family transcriptional regulator n=1 Tax=Phenylobacterium koreense TaxID=266125 RepID=A0ABV2EDW0_9CAUL
MGHLTADPEALLKRVRRIAGQVAAIERSIESRAECGAILHLVAAARGAMSGLLDEIVEAHIHEHLAKPGLSDDDRAKAAQEVIQAFRRYSK